MRAPRSWSSAARSPRPQIRTLRRARSRRRSRRRQSTGPRPIRRAKEIRPVSWLTRVRNSIPFIAKRETPDNLWHKCRSCDSMIFTKEWEENEFVCPRCDHHDRIGPKRRFDSILDGGYTLLAQPQVLEDPLKFRDSKRYTDRLKAARQQTGETDALLNARGTVEGRRAIVGVQDFAFMGGSMGL